MPEYQVLARKYRPQSFTEVLGQSAIVTTLKNAIKYNRLAHAYLFCGSRGTGKTTLARVFAKALNCQALTSDGEPCNKCSSCKEIASGHALDVLEIDGASHRGIDDIRQINETVGYAASSGHYKIYIIDEVHMLTKEAFNALLKTLEEPPAKVMFLFATTEPHKVLPTILSRCQRFNLSRIPLENIIDKLKRIAEELGIDVEEEALRLLAQRADGGLRDAESLFDQIIAFHEGQITGKTISDVLGIVPREVLFTLDKAGKQGDLSVAFDIAHQIFSEGKDLIHFVETLTDHFRTLLLVKLSNSQSRLLTLSEADKAQYEVSAKLYSNEQCMTILDFLIEAQNQIRFQPSSRIALEAILLRIMRTHQRLPVEFLVRRLAELEQSIVNRQSSPSGEKENTSPSPIKTTAPIPVTIEPAKKISLSVTEDPTPSREDLGLKPKKTSAKETPPPPTPAKEIGITPPPTVLNTPPPIEKTKSAESPPPQLLKQPSLGENTLPPSTMHRQSHYDTILQFAAVELEGSLKKKSFNN